MLYPNQWKKGKIVNCSDMMQISQTLDKILTNVRQILLKMIEEGNVDISSIPNELKKKYTTNITFIDFCNQRAIVRKFGKKNDTKERYNRFIKLFTAWGKIKVFEEANIKKTLEIMSKFNKIANNWRVSKKKRKYYKDYYNICKKALASE